MLYNLNIIIFIFQFYFSEAESHLKITQKDLLLTPTKSAMRLLFSLKVSDYTIWNIADWGREKARAH